MLGKASNLSIVSCFPLESLVVFLVSPLVWQRVFPWKYTFPKGSRIVFHSHHFSGVNSLLNFGGVPFINRVSHYLHHPFWGTPIFGFPPILVRWVFTHINPPILVDRYTQVMLYIATLSGSTVISLSHMPGLKVSWDKGLKVSWEC